MTALQLNAQALEEAVVARNIILNEGEDNHYDDSDFWQVYLDRSSRQLVKHYTGSTRWGGTADPLPESTHVWHLNDQLRKYFREQATCIAKEQALQLIIGADASKARSGDTVKVTNPSARKNKGVEIIVHHRSEYCDSFGRVQTTYLHSVDGVKVIEHNCTITAVSDSRLNDLAENLLVGIGL